MIFSRDNPLFPYIQFISKKSGLHLSMLSYNTETGEGTLAGEQRDQRVSLRDETTHRVFDVDKNGNVMRSHFNDKNNIRVNILVPQTLYIAHKAQLDAIQQDPEFNKSIFLDFVREYRPEHPELNKPSKQMLKR